jgi:Flp pilus assembly protein TadD
LADQGENEKALADAESVVLARPNYLPSRVLLAKILVRLKQCPRAVETLQAAHAARQLDAEALFILANAYDCAGQPAQANAVRDEFAAAQQAEHQAKENEVQSKHLVEQTNELARQNQFAEAAELLRRALEKNPQNAFAYSQKAKILFSQGDASGARAAIAQALALQPYQPDFLYVEGIIAKQEGKLDEALDAFAKATQINPKESDAFFEIGKIRLQQGDRPAALAAFKKAATLDPGDPDYQRAVKAASAPK